MKRLIPQGIRRGYHLGRRAATDFLSGHNKRFARGNRRKIRYNGMIETRQPVRPNPSAANKVHNIRLASGRIGQLQILPDEIFSFWHAVGRPSKRRGYKKGRNLVAGRLSESVGGGLCQLSGVIYHTALKAGLDITERHAHSVDIYEEHERYTPLGADATVAYGYKDLRFRNNKPFPIRLSFIVSAGEVVCRIFMEDNMPPLNVKFQREQGDGIKRVITIRTLADGRREEVATSEYL